MQNHDTPADVVAFWRQAGPSAWFAKSDDFDQRFSQRFQQAHHAAARRELDAWADTAEGTLALLILLDQYPRNSFRGTGHMFAADPLARHFARQALARGFDQAVEPVLRPFIYLPFMHSEDAADQALSVRLYEALGGDSVRHAHEHQEIIQRFGRFPHRNPALGRETTAEEAAFLSAGGFAG